MADRRPQSLPQCEALVCGNCQAARGTEGLQSTEGCRRSADTVTSGTTFARGTGCAGRRDTPILLLHFWSSAAASYGSRCRPGMRIAFALTFHPLSSLPHATLHRASPRSAAAQKLSRIGERLACTNQYALGLAQSLQLGWLTRGHLRPQPALAGGI